MDVVRGILLEQIRLRLQSHAQVESFVMKVVCVILAEGLSNTFYRGMTAIIAGDGTMTDLQALIARSMYVAFVTLYAPVVAWVIEKTKWIMTGRSFPATSIKLQRKVCPVLLAWGWKDWAAQLDTWAGAELWDEAAVAICLTVVVVVLQTIPVYIQAKRGVAAGGSEDRLIRRIFIFPSSMMLTLGYVWNLVATWFVTQVQDQYHRPTDDPAYAYQFMVQATYTVVLGILVAVFSVRILLARAESKHVSVDSHWDGPGQTAWSDVALSTMSFVYAWAVLDSCDDWGFGLMFNCTSPTVCSYQSNFVYSCCVTVCFAICAITLNRWQQFEERPMITTMIGLQINAMILTVGWAWMNFYTVFMSSATQQTRASTAFAVHILVLIVIIVFTSIVMYALESIRRDQTSRSRQQIDALEAIGPQAPPRLPGETDGSFQARCLESEARYKSCDESLPADNSLSAWPSAPAEVEACR